MGALKSIFGELKWTPPAWLQRLGLRRFVLVCLAVIAVAALALAGVRYYNALPKPPSVVAAAVAPGITPIVDDKLQPMPLVVDFSLVADPRMPVETVDSVARLDLVGEKLPAGLMLEPEKPGEWRWQSETQLIFEPEGDWPAGQKYTVRFDESLFAPGLRFEKNTVDFTTPEFEVSIEEFIYYQNPADRSERKLVATLSFTHPVDAADLGSELSLAMRESGETVTQPARTVAHSLELDKHQRTAYVHSVAVPVPASEHYATVTINEGLAPQTGPSRLAAALTQNVLIPDAASFFTVQSLTSIITRGEDNEAFQTVTMEFTDRLALQDLQAGLRAYLLPDDVVIKGRTQRNKRWASPREVTAEVLPQAQPIEIQLNPVQDDVSRFHSATLDVPENRFVYVVVEEGLTSEGGFALSRTYDTVVRAPEYPKEANIAQSGAILPLTGSHQLTFVSRGVATLKVEVGRLIDGAVNHLASQSSGDFRSPYFNNYSFNEDNLTVRSERFIDLQAANPREARYSSLDLSEFLAEGGHYFVTVQGWDRENDRPIGSGDKRLVLITDLGLLVKSNADSSQEIFVHSLRSGQPVSGARVALLGKNGMPVFERTTSASGRASMPETDQFKREKAPTVFVVRLGSDSVFIPYASGDRGLQYSRFDVGGEVVRRGVQADQLKAQLFSDRGIYRPGDSGNLAAIVKSINWQPLDNLPLELRVRDPRGTLVLDTSLRLPDDGFFDAVVQTQAAAATGNYQATLYLIDERKRRRAIGSTAFKVEEFQPDRLRVRARVIGGKQRGWIKPGDLVAEVSLHNLFGTPAQSRRVTGAVDLVLSGMVFDKFPDYRFDDPLREQRAQVQRVTLPLDSTRTDEKGIALLALQLGQYDKGIYRLDVRTEGFVEGGGRSVRATAQVMMSPLDFLVGYKSDADLAFIDRGAEHWINFVAVNSDAEPVSLEALTLVVVEERHVSTLIKRPNGTYAYQSILKENEISRDGYAIAEAGSRFALPTDQAGAFAAKLMDRHGLVYSKVRFTVAGARNLAGNLERDAELELVLNGTSFEPGSEIEFEVTAPYTGTGLITIERDRVYAHKWFKTDTTSSVQRIRVPEDLEGNAYVNVAFVRALDSPEVFVSPLSYAAAPFSINRAARTIDVELEVPDTVRPGEEISIGYSTSRPSRVVLYAVDEGILQVAGYQMPNPLDFFMPKMALQVATSQLVDLILPEFAAYQQRAAPGGGQMSRLAGANLNPFRRQAEAPVAFWSSIVDADTSAQSVSFTVPDYFNGELRVMAVAVADAAVGRAEDRSTVRGPFVITPNLLTAAAPGDEFDVSVGVANNLEGSGSGAQIEITAKPSDNLEIISEPSTTLAIDEGAESRTRFRVRAKDQLGPGKLVFEASSGEERVARSATMSVRPSVAYVSTMTAGTSDADPLRLSLDRRLYAQLARQSAAASTSPLVLADGLLEYLGEFPHGCTEQLVSKVFPQVGFLGSGDAAVDHAKIRRVFAETIHKLRSRQTPEGGFRFWATSAEPADFASIYINHFLTDAAELGLSVPKDMSGSGLGYLKTLAGREVRSLADARMRAYAIYILTRHGTVTTNYLTNLHEYLDKHQADAWRSDLGAAYMAASYALLKQEALGRQLIGGYRTGAGPEMVSDFDTRLGRDAQYLYLLARHFPARLDSVDAGTVREMVEPIMQNRFNTLSAAYTILALRAYTDAVADVSGKPMLSIAQLADGTAEELASSAAVVRADIAAATQAVQIAGSAGEDLFYVLTQTGFDRTPQATASAEGIELYREYLDANDQPVTQAGVGDELTVRLRIRARGRAHSNVAVVDLLPGGFEVLTESIRDQYGGWHADYKDIREDRVVIYGTFDDRMTEIRYRVKLTSAGSFVVPSAFAGSMYNRSIQSRTAPGRFAVRPVQ